MGGHTPQAQQPASAVDASIPTQRSGDARRAGAPRWRRGFELLGDWLGYAARVARQRPDVVHLNSAYDRRALQRDLGYALISRLLGQPLFLKFHGSDGDLLERPSPLWRWMTARVLSGASAVGVLSGDERRRFAARWPAVRFEQVRNAVSCDRFAGPRATPGEVPELLFIARLVPAKGLRDCVRATRLLLDQGRRVRLVVVGDGPDRGAGESLARELALGDAVRFVGRVPESEATDFYLRAAMLVFPTAHGEGFSMTIFQSLAAGLPILTTRIRAAADWLQEPDHCLWVEAGQPVPLAERIAWLLDHPEVAARMSEAGRRHARGFDAGYPRKPMLLPPFSDPKYKEIRNDIRAAFETLGLEFTTGTHHVIEA